MSIISGPITNDGAVVVVRVGVSDNRRKALERVGFPVPAPISVKAQLDTGSWATGFQPEVFRALQLTPIDEVPVRTPSTEPGTPHLTSVFDVSVTFSSAGKDVSFESVEAFTAKGFDEHEEAIQAIIGSDILDQCVLTYDGPHRQFTLVL